MGKSLTETAKAVLMNEEGAYPSVSPMQAGHPDRDAKQSNPNLASLKPGSKYKEDKPVVNPGSNPPEGGAEDLGGATPTETAKENLGAKASGKVNKDKSKSSQSTAPVKAEEGHHLEEDIEISEELEAFINEMIEQGASEEEIAEAIEENFEIIDEEVEEIDEEVEEIDEESDGPTAGSGAGIVDKGKALVKRGIRGLGLGDKVLGDNEGTKHMPGMDINKKIQTGQSGKTEFYGSTGSTKKSEQPWKAKTTAPKIQGGEKNSLSGAAKAQRGYMEEDQLKEHVDALLAGEELSEEFRTKAETIFESAVNTRVNEELETLEEAYAQSLEEEVEKIRAELTEQVDDYLNYVVEQWVEQNEVAIETGLRTEITEDFISGLKNLFAEHYIDIPDEKVGVVETLGSKVEELEAKLNEEIDRNVQLNKMINESKQFEVLVSACDDLTTTQAEKLKALADNVTFTTVDEYAQKIHTLKESYFLTTINNENVLDEVAPTGSGLIAEETTGRMGAYVKALGKKLPN